MAQKGDVIRSPITLRGNPARKVRRIAEREGNPVAAVLRRLISQGLACERFDDEETK